MADRFGLGMPNAYAVETHEVGKGNLLLLNCWFSILADPFPNPVKTGGILLQCECQPGAVGPGCASGEFLSNLSVIQARASKRARRIHVCT
jgi:hypothetical protein